MKKVTILILGLCTIFVLKAQTPSYWTTQSNIHSKNFTIVRFYDNHDNLLYEEKLENQYLDIKKKSVIRKLNKAMKEFEKAQLQSANLEDKKIIENQF